MCVYVCVYSNICKYLISNDYNFHPLKVVGRGSETQLQLGKKLNDLIYRFEGKIFEHGQG